MKSAVCLQTKFRVLYDINWCHDHSMTKNVFIPILYCSMWKLSEKSLNMIEKYLVFTILNKLHILSMPNHCIIFYYLSEWNILEVLLLPAAHGQSEQTETVVVN